MSVQLKHWLMKSFDLRRLGERDAQITIDGVTQQRARPCHTNKERHKMFSEKLYDFKCLGGKYIIMLIFLIIEEIFTISFLPNLSELRCLLTYWYIRTMKDMAIKHQNIKEARISIPMMNNNGITVWSCYYLPIIKMSKLRLVGLR